jgi:hypothetical protein
MHVSWANLFLFWAVVLFYLCSQTGGNIILRLQLEINHYRCEVNSNRYDGSVMTEIQKTTFTLATDKGVNSFTLWLQSSLVYFLHTASSELNNVSAQECYDADTDSLC